MTLKDLGQDPNDPPAGGAPQRPSPQATAGATVSPGDDDGQSTTAKAVVIHVPQ